VRKSHDNAEKNMTFLEHLEELRVRLILSLIFLLLGCVVGLFSAKHVVQFLVLPFQRIDFRRQDVALKVRVTDDGSLRFAEPVGPDLFKNASSRRLEFYAPETPLDAKPDFVWGAELNKPIFLNPLDPIMLYFKAALIVGLIVALPFVLHQLWLFVAPGLHLSERRAVLPVLILAGVFFPIGAGFAWLMMSMILDFLLNFQIVSMEPFLEITRFVNFELRLMLGFGAVFEMPLIVVFLTAIGIVTPAMLRQYRPHAIVAIAVLSMMLTPPDPFSMLLMMGPLLILYEISIWASVIFARRRAKELESAS